MRLNELMPHPKRIEPSKEVSGFYDFCVSKCIEWFGSPPDMEWPTQFFTARWGSFFRVDSGRFYGVVLGSQTQDRFNTAYTIATTAFRRVCSYRPGPWKPAWIEDVLEARTIARLLSNRGHNSLTYLEAYDATNDLQTLSANSRRWEPYINVPKVIGWRKPRWWLGRCPPRDYRIAVWLLGERLEVIVGWEGLCRLARCLSYEEWLRSLPTAQRDLVKQATKG
jgi:hypothetical protein